MIMTSHDGWLLGDNDHSSLMMSWLLFSHDVPKKWPKWLVIMVDYWAIMTSHYGWLLSDNDWSFWFYEILTGHYDQKNDQND